MTALFRLYKGGDRRITIRPYTKQGETKTPMDLSGSSFLCRIFRCGFTRPIVQVEGLVGEDGESIVLDFKREMTDTLPPDTYSIDILRDADRQGRGERSPIFCGCVEVCLVGAGCR